MPTYYVAHQLLKHQAVFNQDAASVVVDQTNGLVRGLLLQVTSVAGAPDVKLEYAVSAYGQSFGALSDYTDVVASSAGLTSAEGLMYVAFGPVYVPYLQFTFTGLAGNQADTLVDFFVVHEEAE